MKPILTVDVVLLTLLEGQLQAALFQRAADPFAAAWALPGGFIHEEDASVADAAARVLADKTGIVSPYLEELCTFSGPCRDPRGWSLTVAYFALVAPEVLLSAPASSLRLVPAGPPRLRGLPFDHRDIIEAAVARVRSKSAYSSLPVHLCNPTFSIPELHAVYEAVLGVPLDRANFRRKLEDLNLLEEVPDETRGAGRHRPARLYRQRKEFMHALSVRGRGIGG